MPWSAMTGDAMEDCAKRERKVGKKLHLTIRGVQTGFGEEEVTEIATTADYFHRAGKHYIFYEERTEEGHIIKNRLTIDPDRVELKKSGAGESLLRFRFGHSQPCRYHSPAGPLELMSDTKRIDFHRDKKGIRLHLDYSFYAAGMLMSEYRLTVSGRFI